MKIGGRLREARVAAGLTQEIAAEKMNVSRQTISNWETESGGILHYESFICGVG